MSRIVLDAEDQAADDAILPQWRALCEGEAE